jgi:hypothetical protein
MCRRSRSRPRSPRRRRRRRAVFCRKERRASSDGWTRTAANDWRMDPCVRRCTTMNRLTKPDFCDVPNTVNLERNENKTGLKTQTKERAKNMKLASKMMAVAVLALVAGSASAAAVATPSSAAVGAPIAISIAGGDATETYTITASSPSITVTPIAPGNIITTDAGGNGGGVSVTGTLAGNYTITATPAGAGAVLTVNIVITDNELEVTINVSLSVPVQVVLVNGLGNEVATLTWTLNAKSLATTYTSAVAGTDPFVINVRNKGGASVNVAASLVGNGNWTPTTQTAGGTAINEFWANAIGADDTVELDNTLQSITDAIAPAATSVTSLEIHTPTTVSTTTSGNIVVRYTATNN